MWHCASWWPSKKLCPPENNLHACSIQSGLLNFVMPITSACSRQLNFTMQIHVTGADFRQETWTCQPILLEVLTSVISQKYLIWKKQAFYFRICLVWALVERMCLRFEPAHTTSSVFICRLIIDWFDGTKQVTWFWTDLRGHKIKSLYLNLPRKILNALCVSRVIVILSLTLFDGSSDEEVCILSVLPQSAMEQQEICLEQY